MVSRILPISIFIASFFKFTAVLACTNFIITKGASSDHSVMITYNADSHTRYGAKIGRAHV